MRKARLLALSATAMVLMFLVWPASSTPAFDTVHPIACRRIVVQCIPATSQLVFEARTDNTTIAGKHGDEKKADKGGAKFLPEFLPRAIQQRIDKRNYDFSHRLKPTGGKAGVNPQHFFIQMSRRWEIGSTVTVAFHGGNKDLRAKIETAANEWTKYANLKFDFRDTKGNFRTWSLADTEFQSLIRISFTDPQGGAFSTVGKDSADPDIISPGQASMNFQDFHIQLPDDYAATVMHEFGHAIGFLHEHQSPLGGCDVEFDWNAIDALLLGAGWSKAEIDFNMKQMPNSSAFEVGPYDRLSIMHYHFPGNFFVKGESSHCFVPKNLVLSDGDKAGARKAYPKTNADITAIKGIHIRNLEAILESKHLDPKTKAKIESRLKNLQK